MLIIIWILLGLVIGFLLGNDIQRTKIIKFIRGHLKNIKKEKKGKEKGVKIVAKQNNSKSNRDSKGRFIARSK